MINTKKIKQRKFHKATMVSEVGSLFVLLFVIAILLLYINYSKIIMTKIELDDLKKNMLLTAEMYGGLSEEDMNAFYTNLENMGIPRNSIINANFPTIKDKGKIHYGTEIEISYTVRIASPIYEQFHGSFFNVDTSPTLSIPIYGVTVSKW